MIERGGGGIWILHTEWWGTVERKGTCSMYWVYQYLFCNGLVHVLLRSLNIDVSNVLHSESLFI